MIVTVAAQDKKFTVTSKRDYLEKYPLLTYFLHRLFQEIYKTKITYNIK